MKQFTIWICVKVFILLGCSTVCALQVQYKYVIQTDFVDFLSIEDQAKNEIYEVPAYIKSSGGFLVSCSDPKQASVYNNSQGKNIYFKVFSIGQDKSTEIVKLLPGDKISFEILFEEYVENYVWTSISDMYERMSKFINEARYGTVTKGKAAYLQGSNSRFEFLQIEPNFTRKQDLRLSWVTEDPIKAIVFLQNDIKLFKHKMKGENILSYNILSKRAKNKLQTGQKYTIKLLLKDKSVHTNKFYIMSSLELETFDSFIKASNL